MRITVLDHQQVLKKLPDRPQNAHKGNFGKLLLLCGSKGYTGAAALSAMGALRCGAGLVYLAVPESIYIIEATKLTEAIVQSVKDDSGTFSVDAVGQILPMLSNKDAVLIGPGIGLSAGSDAVLTSVLTHYEGPLIIDADGITLAAAHKNLLRGRKGPTIITPHAGEFVRLAGQMENDRMSAAIKLSRELNAIVLLKGHNTLITDGYHAYQNPTGNPGMATGGSGDVLAGMIVALIGQGLSALDATACAAWLHGAAGDICADEIGQYAMLPSDIISVLPRLLK